MTPVEYLRSSGRSVEEQDIPGLYRVDGGPEITFGQLMQLAKEVRESMALKPC